MIGFEFFHSDQPSGYGGDTNTSNAKFFVEVDFIANETRRFSRSILGNTASKNLDTPAHK
jgi:hypothetical protein